MLGFSFMGRAYTMRAIHQICQNRKLKAYLFQRISYMEGIDGN